METLQMPLSDSLAHLCNTRGIVGFAQGDAIHRCCMLWFLNAAPSQVWQQMAWRTTARQMPVDRDALRVTLSEVTT